MNNGPIIKSCGREPGCELVLAHPSVSRVHAHLELLDDGLVRLRDAGSSNGTFINRNESWIRIKRATLCIGDLVRFGEVEVPLAELMSRFGDHPNSRLEARHFPLRKRQSGQKTGVAIGKGETLNKPRRNPVTGKIEDTKTV